jgi:RNA polymerase sigma factor (TIGR02999 family)
MHDVTQLLERASRGERKAAHELLSIVYEELRRLAAVKIASEAPGQTLQATALVHEAWLRLTADHEREWNDRTHFFASAAEAMRRILVDNARRKRALRHGGGLQRVEMPEIKGHEAATDDQILAVNEALERFSEKDPQKANLVKLRYFVGMTIEEAAKAIGISAPTAKRHWAYARAWLAEEMKAANK